MYIVKAPFKKQLYQVYDFGSVTFEYPTSLTDTKIDEIIVSSNDDTDQNIINFVQRYDTWLAFTDIQDYTVKNYAVILVHYDRVNQIAYTHSDTLKITPVDP